MDYVGQDTAMFYWPGKLMFGVFFTILKTSITSDHHDEWIFPEVCFGHHSDFIPLNNNEVVHFTVAQHIPIWMSMFNTFIDQQDCNRKPCQTSIACQKSFDLSGLLRKNFKIYVKVKVDQQIYYFCPFTFLLYSGDSVQPIQEIPCWILFHKTFHWPDTNLTLAVKFNPKKASSFDIRNDTKISIQVGTCRNCFKMRAASKQVHFKSPYVEEKTWQGQLPWDCTTRICLEYRPFTYTVSAYSCSGTKNKRSQAPCYITFDLKDETRTSRLTICLQLSWRKYGVLQYDNKLLLVLRIDGVTYMEFRTSLLDEFWCLPYSWLRQKSILTLQWNGCQHKCCVKEPWKLIVKSNFSQSLPYYSLCNRDPYREKNVSFSFTKTNSGPDPHNVTMSVKRYNDVLEWTILSAALCTAFVTIISILVVCVIRRRRSRTPTSRNVPQRPQRRSVPNRTENNPTYGLTELEELTSVIPAEPNPDNQLPNNLDPPPPYQGNDTAPPSYEEVCQFLPVR